jgi:DNA/RNA-binding domain of Phe-tRNA-synthetase-like protein
VSEGLELRTGSVEPRVQAEFPGLSLDWVTVPARSHDSPPEVRRRLKALSDRYRGANVVAMRTRPIPHAYRAFFRHIGLDPDVSRIPSERAAVARLLHGEFRSEDLLRDALLIALIETGVPVWALDAELVTGGLGIRTTVPGDILRTGDRDGHLAPGRLVVSDADRVHELLFGDPAPGRRVGSGTTSIALYAVGVDGVPAIAVQEALWVSVEVLDPGTAPGAGW